MLTPKPIGKKEKYFKTKRSGDWYDNATWKDGRISSFYEGSGCILIPPKEGTYFNMKLHMSSAIPDDTIIIRNLKVV